MSVLGGYLFLLWVDLEPTDIDDLKNIIRLDADIEHKFDRFYLTFVQSGGAFYRKVLEPNIKLARLKGATVNFGQIEKETSMAASPWRSLNYSASPR